MDKSDTLQRENVISGGGYKKEQLLQVAQKDCEAPTITMLKVMKVNMLMEGMNRKYQLKKRKYTKKMKENCRH